jgi:hypothetical protein
VSALVFWIGGGAVAAVVAATFWGMWREASPESPPWADRYNGDESAEGHSGHHSGGGGGNFVGPADGGGHH